MKNTQQIRKWQACMRQAAGILAISQTVVSVVGQDLHQSISKQEFEKSRQSLPFAGHTAILKVCDNDTRTNANPYEKSRTVRLVGTFGSARTVGTGFLVSDRCVVTAGHVVFNSHPEKKGAAFADLVTVEFNGQTQVSPQIFTVTGCLAGVSECDYGAVILESSFAGARPFGYGDDGNDGGIEAGGFPRQKPNMLVDHGTITGRSGLLVNYAGINSEKGQSGGPVFRPDSNVLAIHTESVCDGQTPVGTGVGISGRVKDNIDKWTNTK